MADNNPPRPIETTPAKNLLLTMGLNFLITIAEVIGGLIAGSLALISDALHNLSDGVAIIIAYLATKISQRPKTQKYTFGLKRAEIMAAIINAITLIIISFFLIREAINRFSKPTPITGSLMLIVASVGLAANVGGTLLLKKGSAHSLNLRAAYVHLLGDAFSSVAVMMGAAFIIFFKIYWVDPLLTILISIYILKEAYTIVKEAVDILMMSNVAGIDLNEIKKIIEKISGVLNVHHIHLWKLSDNDTHFEAHVEVKDLPVSQTAAIQKQIAEELQKRYAINHTTLQFECRVCQNLDIISS